MMAPIQGFAIAGKDGRFQPAQAQWLDKNAGKGDPNWERSVIVLASALVQEPIYFRYAWARNPLENLKSSDNAGLPFDTQRNDPFSLADMHQIYTGKNTSKPGVLQDGEKRELIQALKRPLKLDPTTESFINDDEANRLKTLHNVLIGPEQQVLAGRQFETMTKKLKLIHFLLVNARTNHAHARRTHEHPRMYRETMRPPGDS